MIDTVKHYCLYLLITLPASLHAQRPHITGYVTEQNSGKKRVAGVLVKAAAPARTNQLITGNDGSFSLIFQDMLPGQNAYILAEKKDWLVVNEKELNKGIPSAGEDYPVQIVMCTAESLEQARKSYYEITDRHIQQQYEKRLASINRAEKGWQVQAKTLNEQLNNMRKQIGEIADSYSRINIDDLTTTEKRAIELFKAGNIEAGILLRENLQTSVKLQIARRRSRELDSVIALHTRNLKTLANEYALVFDFVNAEKKLQQLATADTTNAEYSFLLGMFLHRQNQYQKAVAWYETALRHSANIPGGLVSIYNNLASLYHTIQRYTEADRLFKIAIDSCKQLIPVYGYSAEVLYANLLAGNSHVMYDMRQFHLSELAINEARNILIHLHKLQPKIHAVSLAHIESNIARIYKQNQETSKAKNALQSALSLYTELAIADPGEYEHYTATTEMNMGIVLMEEGQFNDAVPFFKRAEQIFRKLASNNPAAYNEYWAKSNYNQGVCYQNTFKLKAAEESFLVAEKTYTKLILTDPAIYEPYLAMVKRGMADVYHLLKKYNLAEQYHLEAVRIYDNLTKDITDAQISEVITAKNNLGFFYKEAGNYAAAVKVLVPTEIACKELVRQDSIKFIILLTTVQFNLAAAYTALEKYNEAEKRYLDVLKIWQQMINANPVLYQPKTGTVYLNLSLLYQLNEQYNKAEEYANKASLVFQQHKDTHSAEYAALLESYGNLFAYKKNYTRAIDSFAKACSIWRKLAALYPFVYEGKVASNLYMQADNHESNNNLIAAEQICSEAVAMLNKLSASLPDAFAPLLATALNQLKRIRLSRFNIAGHASAADSAVIILRRLYKKNIVQYGSEFCNAAFDLCRLYEHFPTKKRMHDRETLLTEISTIVKYLPQSEAKPILEQYKKAGDNDILNKIITYKKQIDTATNKSTIVAIQEKIITARQNMSNSEDIEQQILIGKDYGWLSWYLLLDKRYALAEEAARNALFPGKIGGSSRNYNAAVNWVYTNLASAMLLQGKFKEAEAIYKEWKDKPLQHSTFKTFFLADLNNLEKEGIYHKDFSRIRALLNQ